MTIGELVNNGEFYFNARFRILWYFGDGDNTTVMFDSDKSGDVPYDLCCKNISAINTGDDGVLEIEYIDFITY